MIATSDKTRLEELVEDMTGIVAGDVVRVLAEVVAEDRSGNHVLLPEGTKGSVIQIYSSTVKLEVECLIDNEVVTACINLDEVELIWSERVAQALDDMVT